MYSLFYDPMEREGEEGKTEGDEFVFLFMVSVIIGKGTSFNVWAAVVQFAKFKNGYFKDCCTVVTRTMLSLG